MRWLSALIAVVALCASGARAAERNIPKDLSKVRGFDYTPANADWRPAHHVSQWLNYSHATTEFDLSLAKRLNLNQVRVFLAYQAWEQDKAAFGRNVLDFVRTCHQHDIGVMLVVTYPREMIADKAKWPQAREWAAHLVETLGREQGLDVWDVVNEPARPPTPA